MGLFSNKISREEVKPGDHIYTWRTAYVYAHHGIYVGDNKVIHFTRGGGQQTETWTFLDKFVVSSSSNYPPCLICKDNHSFNGDKVITSCLDCFLAGGKLYLFRYDVSWVAFLSKPRGGTCTTAPSDPPEDVLFRANFHLLIDGWFGDYKVVDKNCEDFAIYCKTGLLLAKNAGLGASGQVNSVGAAVFAALVLGLSGLPVAELGVYCWARLASDVGMPRPDGDVIKVSVEKLISVLKPACSSAREG